MKRKIQHILFTGMLFLVNVTSYSQTAGPRPANWATRMEVCDLENLFKLNDSIFRSEQPDEKEFACLSGSGIRGVLNLRSHHVDSSMFKGSSLKPYTVEMAAGKFTDREIIESLQILKNGKKPLLVHCLHGSDRTGVVIAMYRIIFENWTREQALDELQNGGYGFHKQYTNITDYIRDVDIPSIRGSVMK